MAGFLKSVDKVFTEFRVHRNDLDPLGLASKSSEMGELKEADVAAPPMPGVDNPMLRQAVALLKNVPPHSRGEEDVKLLMTVFSGIRFFARRKEPRQRMLCTVMELRTVEEGEIIFNRGDSAEFVYIIITGNVSIMSQMVTEETLDKQRRTSAVSEEDLVALQRAESDEAQRPLAMPHSSSLAPRTEAADATSLASPISALDPARHLDASSAPSPAPSSPALTPGASPVPSGASTPRLSDDMTAKTILSQRDDRILKRLDSVVLDKPDMVEEASRTVEVCALSAGDAFGERCVFEMINRSSMAVARSKTQLLAIDKWAYQEFARSGVKRQLMDRIRREYLRFRIPDGPPNCDTRLLAPSDRLEADQRLERDRWFFQSKLDVNQDRFKPDSQLSPFQLEQRNAKRKWISDRYLRDFYLEDDLTMAQRLHKAAMFIEDALEGRSVRAHRTTPWARRFDVFFNSRAYQGFMFLVVLVHMSLVLWEPPSFRDLASSRFDDRRPWLIGIEITCVVLYLLELGYQLWDLGLYWFLSSSLRTAHIVVIGIIIADVLATMGVNGIGSGTEYLRFSRVLRPLLLLFHSAHMRKMYIIALSVIPRLFELIVLSFGVLIFFATIGLYLFLESGEQIYDEAGYNAGSGVFAACSATSAAHNSTTSCPELPSFVFDSFSHSYFHAMLSLFVLLTTANFPDIMNPSYVVDHLNASFFIAFIAVGTFFLLNLAVAVMYDAYRDKHLVMLRAEARYERRALGHAFRILDIHDAGVMTWDVFRLLIKTKKHADQHAYQIHALFKLMDTDGDGVIDEDEFLEIIDALFVRVTRSAGAVFQSRSSRDHVGALPVIAFTSAIVEKLVTSKFWQALYAVVITVDCAALLLFDAQNGLYSDIDVLCFLYFVFEMLLSLYGLGWSQFVRQQWRLYSVAITLMHGLGLLKTETALLDAIGGRGYGVLRYFGLMRFMRVVAYLGSMRLFLGRTYMSSLTQTIVRMVPLYLGMAFSLLAIVFYPFAIVGMESFYGNGELDGLDRCADAEFINYDIFARFCDFPASFLTLFQILTASNWHLIMYEAIDEVSTPSWVFFVLFYFICVIVLLNLLLSVFLDIFMAEREVKLKTSLAEFMNGGATTLAQVTARQLTANQMGRRRSSIELTQAALTVRVLESDSDEEPDAGHAASAPNNDPVTRGTFAGLTPRLVTQPSALSTASSAHSSALSAASGASTRSIDGEPVKRKKTRGISTSDFGDEYADNIHIEASNSFGRIHRRLKHTYDTSEGGASPGNISRTLHQSKNMSGGKRRIVRRG